MTVCLLKLKEWKENSLSKNVAVCGPGVHHHASIRIVKDIKIYTLGKL